MTVNINLDMLNSVLKDLEQEKLSRTDRSFLIRLLRELVEATQKSPQMEGDAQSFIKVLIQGAAENQVQRSLDEQVAEQEKQRRSEFSQVTEANLVKVLVAILDSAYQQVDDLYDSYIFLYEAGRLSFAAGRSSSQREELPWSIPRPRGLTYTAARLGQTLVIPDMSTHPLFAGLDWTGSIIGIPLKIGPRVVGVMTISRRPMRDFSADELHFIQILADQAAVNIENARINRLAGGQVRIDLSTGLHNRRSLEERLEREIINASDGQFPFALFMLDLDGFAEINQRFGRSAGDFLLAETATAISKDLRKTDFLARFDSSRYSLMLSRTDRSTAQAVAERILEIISHRRFNLPEKGTRKVSLSIGIALFPGDGLTAQGLIEQAESALSQSCAQPGSICFASLPEQNQEPNLAP